MFFLIAVAIWAAAHLYVFHRLLSGLDLSRRAKLAVYPSSVVAFAIAPATMIATRTSPSDSQTILIWAGLIYLGFFTIVFFFLLLRDAATLVTRGLLRIFRRSESVDPARRRFLLHTSNAAVLGVSGGLSAWGIQVARQRPEVVEVDVPIRDLPESFVGYRIAQLSDIHIGPTIRGDFLRGVVADVNALEPDLVAVTGDLVDGWVDELAPHVAPLANLESRDGAFFVTGNHEYYWGAPAWCDYVASLGLRVLDDVHHVIRRGDHALVVAGVSDYSSSRRSGAPSDPAKALAGAPTDAIRVLLAHQPRSLYGAQQAGFHLQLSGHTHGGQYFPWNLFIGLVQPVARGLALIGDLYVYVNRGTGYWGPPLRGGVPPEITLLKLVRE